MVVVQKVISLTKILHSSHTSQFCMGLIYTEIKTEIGISFSIFIRSGNVLP